MKNTYFKLLGQKTVGNKVILVAVVDTDVIGKDLPMIFELQAAKLAPTAFTGIYPTVKINMETLKDVTKEFVGCGIDGILTSNKWYCEKKEVSDVLGIGLTGG